MFKNINGYSDDNYFSIESFNDTQESIPDYYKIFDGECKGSNEFLGLHQKDNNGDWKTLKNNCAVACKNKKSPQGKEAKGFIVKKTDGRCFCETDESKNCNSNGRITNNTDYTRFDFYNTEAPTTQDGNKGLCSDGIGGEIRFGFTKEDCMNLFNNKKKYETVDPSGNPIIINDEMKGRLVYKKGNNINNFYNEGIKNIVNHG
jgi:hypothetical protein